MIIMLSGRFIIPHLMAEVVFYRGIPFEITQIISALRISWAQCKVTVYRGVLYLDLTVLHKRLGLRIQTSESFLSETFMDSTGFSRKLTICTCMY